jgi:NitT/TauT family transport system permease protein
VDGFRAVDPDIVRALRTLGAGRTRLFREVEVPMALPALFSGTKVAVTYSVIGAVLGEWVGASRGLGYVMIEASSQMVTARVFAAIALLSAFGVALFTGVALLERVLLPWYPGARRTPHGVGQG